MHCIEQSSIIVSRVKGKAQDLKAKQVIKMNRFANYKNGELTIATYRFPDAQVTDVADILNAIETESEEILVASIDTEEELQALEAKK